MKFSNDKIPAHCGFASVMPDFDFETYSEAGYVFDHSSNKWKSIAKSPPHGLSAVGAAVYSEHPSTEILSLAYDLKDGLGPRLWAPGLPDPVDLFEHIRTGKLLEAWNSAFEYFVWENVAHKRMGWPRLDIMQLRDAMAKAKCFALPGALGKASDAINASIRKNTDGKRLISKFSKPRNPTKKNSSKRNDMLDHQADAAKMYTYNIDDILAESSVSQMLPDLSDYELRVFLLDQKINARGVHADRDSVNACIDIIEQATRRYTAELIDLTGGRVDSPSKVKVMSDWLRWTQGLNIESLQASDVSALLENENVQGRARRVLEIRSILGAANHKKVFAIKNRMTADNRIKGMFQYYGAERTGRFAGRGPQPQNLTSKGPRKKWNVGDVDDALEIISKRNLDMVENEYGNPIATVAGCLRGLFTAAPGKQLIGSDFSSIEAVALACLAGETWRIDAFKRGECIYTLSASDITGVSIETLLDHKVATGEDHPLRKQVGKVGELACFAPATLVLTDSGWKRIVDVHISDLLFDGVEYVKHSGVVNKGVRKVVELDGTYVTPDHKFYLGDNLWFTAAELIASNDTYLKALAINADVSTEFLDEKKRHKRPLSSYGQHDVCHVFDVTHCGPNNRFVVMTDSGVLIAHNSGYGGSVGAWKAFGAEKHFKNDDEILCAVKSWRRKSPNIVKFWYKTYDAAVNAVRNPGAYFSHNGIYWACKNDILYCRLPSGRLLVYHQPRLNDETKWGRVHTKLSYMGYNSDPTKGPMGWVRLDTWHGKITENITQAAARDILTYSMLNLEDAHYPIVLHVHDEIISEVLEGFGSVEEFENIMGIMPEWAKDWPIRAAGGWIGNRYRKG